MRNILFGTLAFLTLASCGSKSEQVAQKTGQEIFFEETTYNYGEIEQHSDGLHAFQFKNIGDKPLVINKVRTTCGCTAPQWSSDPIEPGETGEISIRYNTALTGSFMKSSYVYSSAANSPVKLTLKGKVLEKPAEPKAEKEIPKAVKKEERPDKQAEEMPEML